MVIFTTLLKYWETKCTKQSGASALNADTSWYLLTSHLNFWKLLFQHLHLMASACKTLQNMQAWNHHKSLLQELSMKRQTGPAFCWACASAEAAACSAASGAVRCSCPTISTWQKNCKEALLCILNMWLKNCSRIFITYIYTYYI